MEIVFVIGMLLAFLLGAYIRKPFFIVKKELEHKSTEKEKLPRIVSEWNNMMSYTGRRQEGGIDED